MTLTIFGGKTEKEIIEILQEGKFLQKCGVCEKCHVQRRLNASKDHKGGFGARCLKCKKFKRLTDGTFFDQTRISFEKIFLIMYLWCAGVPQNEKGKLLQLTSQHTKVNYYQFCRDICSHHLLATPGLFQFGGPGVVVQIDECYS